MTEWKREREIFIHIILERLFYSFERRQLRMDRARSHTVQCRQTIYI